MPDTLDIYVLMMLAVNPNGGVGTLTQEFYTKEACMSAAQDIVKKAPKAQHTLKIDLDNVRFGCYPKYMNSRADARRY